MSLGDLQIFSNKSFICMYEILCKLFKVASGAIHKQTTLTFWKGQSDRIDHKDLHQVVGNSQVGDLAIIDFSLIDFSLIEFLLDGIVCPHFMH